MSGDRTLLLYDDDVVEVVSEPAGGADLLSSIGGRTDTRSPNAKPTAYVVGTAKGDDGLPPFMDVVHASMGLSHPSLLAEIGGAVDLTQSATGLRDLCLTWHNVNALAEGGKVKVGKGKKRSYLPAKQI